MPEVLATVGDDESNTVVFLRCRCLIVARLDTYRLRRVDTVVSEGVLGWSTALAKSTAEPLLMPSCPMTR